MPLHVSLLYAYRLRHAFPGIVFGLAWTALLLIPIPHLLPFGNTPLAAHYMYMPGVGFALALVKGVTLGVQQVESMQRRKLTAALLMALIAVLWLPDAS